MLEYIRKQLQAKTGRDEEAVQEAQMDEAILECAHLFQEMDDLSMNGKPQRAFNRMSIPLEDDIEITSLELNMLDGRVTNIPGDATVQESEFTDYSKFKTRDDFVQEAYATLSQFARETGHQYDKRVYATADKMYKEYTEKLYQEGLFGGDMIHINDERVPSRVTINFGECDGKDYYVKLPVLFELDKKNRITRKQLETAYIIRDADGLGVMIRDAAFKIWGEKVNCTDIDKIWKFVTPTRILILVDPVDKYHAAFEFEIDGETKRDYLALMIPVNSGKKKNAIAADDLNRVSSKELGAVTSNAMSKMDVVRMEEAMYQKPKHSRFFQEEIDFGNPDTAPDADPNAASVSIDGGDNSAPEISGDAPSTDADATAPTDTPAVDDGTAADGQKELVTVNDVSNEIAEKISDDTNADADINTDDVNLDATNSSDVSDDLGATDEPTEDDLNAELGTDTSSEMTDTPSEVSDIDFDNMTMDELLAQGTERLKGMTLQQLKDFLQSPEGTAPDVAQEAFFLTRGNIGKELDIHLRKALGILNDNEMEIEELCDAFRKEGRQCNRVVHKASKMKKVFNEAEIKQLLRLNHCLSDLMAMMRADVKQSEIMTVKRMIQAFVSEATGVLKMLETREKPADDGEPVQEGFFDGLRKKSSDKRLQKIEAQSGPLPEDLKRYLSTEKGIVKWRQDHHGQYMMMVKDGSKYHIICRVYYPEEIQRARKLSVFIPLFSCFNDELVGYSVKDKVYGVYDMSGENQIKKLSDSMKGLLDSFKNPDPTDTDYIEAGCGYKLPEGFKKVYKSKAYQEILNESINIPDEKGYDTEYWVVDNTYILMWMWTDELVGEDAEFLHPQGTVPFGVIQCDDELLYYNGKVYVFDTKEQPDAEDFEAYIKMLNDGFHAQRSKANNVKGIESIGQKFIDKVQKEAPSFVQEAYYPPKDLDRFKSHITKCESIIGRSLPDGYKRLLESGIEDIGIKGADGWFQGCEWGLIESSLRDRGKYDYAGHPGAEFIPLANNGRGDEILMGNKSKTDTRIFTYVHDAKNGLKQIAKSWDEFEKLLYTIKESDSKYDTTNMNFFGKEYKVRIPRGISLESTYKALDIVKNSEKLLNDSVRKQIRDYMESWKSEMSESELKSADWEHPEKHLRPAYVYANDRSSKWDTMIDCDWDFDNEHGLAIIFGNNMKFKDVSQAGNYL